MGVPRRGIPLKDRPVLRPGEHLPTAPPKSTRLCLVHGPAEAEGSWPGVVVEWRRTDSGTWAALVVYVVSEGNTTTVVQMVLDAAYLRPVHP